MLNLKKCNEKQHYLINVKLKLDDEINQPNISNNAQIFTIIIINFILKLVLLHNYLFYLGQFLNFGNYVII